MEREVERLNTLIAQLLTLSRLECLEQAPPKERLTCEPCWKRLPRMPTSRRPAWTGGCDWWSRVLLHLGARDLVRSAVENVVRNALKYTDSNTQVRVRLFAVGSDGDDHCGRPGAGRAGQALDHMFEPFYRVDEARDRRSGGTGLGLAITQQIVALHGGYICASNRPEGGLELRITLPLVG